MEKMYSLFLAVLMASSSSFAVGAPLTADVRVEVVAKGLEVPWSLAFAPDGRLLFTERPGRIRVIEGGVLRPQPLAELRVAAVGEGGLLGLALHPNFSQNFFVYVYYTYRDEVGRLSNRIARLTERGGRLVDHMVILDSIPGAGIHDGGRIQFGADGKLYIATGDAAQPQLSQDLNSLAGKVLRINPDGSIPSDNPFPGSPVYTYGHRNPQGIDWHPTTGKAFVTEHGSQARDEVNILEPGRNYGWPLVQGRANDPRFVDPLIDTGLETWAPSGASFYRGDRIREWRGNFFIATLRNNHLRMIVLKAPGFNEVERTEALFRGEFGRLRDAVQGPDGYLYLATSNRDGRGSPHPDDDRILRVRPIVDSFEIIAEGRTFVVAIQSNSSLSSFTFSQALKQVSFMVSGPDGTKGFANVSVAKALLGGPYAVSVDGAITAPSLKENTTHSTLHFTYTHSSKVVRIIGTTVIPEFPVPVAVLVMTFLIIIAGRKISWRRG